MAYNGYGYANYQQPNARGQSQTPYASSSHVPKPAEAALQSNRQEYGQRDMNWSGQNIPGAQSSNPQNARNNYWMSSTNNALSQPVGYQQQVPYRASDTDQTANSARQYNNQSQPQHSTSTQGISGYRVEPTPHMGIRNNSVASGAHYATSNSQAQARVVSPTTASQTYQPRASLNQLDSTQNSRTAAATAMTALSSASRYNYSHNMSASTSSTYPITNSTQYNTQDPGSTRSHVGASTANSSNTLYPHHTGNLNQSSEGMRMSSATDIRQTGDTSDMSMPSASPSAEPLPQLQHRAHQTQTAARSPSLPRQVNKAPNSRIQAHSTARAYAVNLPAPNDTQPAPALSHNTYSQPTETTSTAATSVTQTSLPKFVDPTNIYNPYYRQFGVSEDAATSQSSDEQNSTLITGQAERAQMVTQHEVAQSPAPSQSPALSITAPDATHETSVSNTHMSTPEVPKGKTAPKDVSKDAPKKARKRASRKRKSDATAASRPAPAEPQASSAAQGKVNDNEDTASQMQRMLDEMRMKDPNLFKSLLAANM
ncbi:hypothetical protein FQN49_002607, partial [Arthroderma sp. PD_2]